MGSGSSQPVVRPGGSEDSLAPMCDPCVNLRHQAQGWCGQCEIYLCPACISSHNRSHRLSRGRYMPETRPHPNSITNNVAIKVVSPLATLEDKEAKQDGISLEERCIRGCVCCDQYIVTITLHHLTLYTEDFECIGDIDYEKFNPNSISSKGNDIVVSFERPKELNKTQSAKLEKREQVELENMLKAFKDIQTYELKLPGCASNTKLVKRKGLDTDGECFSTAVCPLYDKHLTIAVGMRLDKHPERDDIKFQIQIIKANGKILQTLDINPRGEPCFTGEFFLTATMKFMEIAVSEIKGRQIRGINMKTGKTIYQFEGGSPQGITCDLNDNIYVYNDDQFYWIPPLRNKIHYMQQGYSKRARKDPKMAVAISYNDTTRTLYKTCFDKETIETYTVTG